MSSLFKKILKSVIWLAISFVLLFTITILLIQIPAIQTKLTNYAISFISGKTHTKVEIKKISLSFPKSVIIKGLFLEDLKRDTLLYAGELKINIAVKNLLSKEIHIKLVSLDDANLQLSRTEADSLFNYDFLVTAFSDTSNLKKVEPKKPSKWTVSISMVKLKKIRLQFNDQYGGINAGLVLKYLELKMDKIDLTKSIYTVNSLNLNGLTVNAELKKSEKLLFSAINRLKMRETTISVKNGLIISVKQINLEDNSIAYQDLSKPASDHAFDANNLVYKHITLETTDVYYSSTVTKALIKKFSATDQNGFSITKLETDFSMDPHSISAKRIEIETLNSALYADFTIHYSSLKTLADSMNSVIINADIQNSRIRNSDITYFYSKLDTLAFFKNSLNYTTLSGSIRGTMGNLIGKDMVIKTGDKTVLNTDFTIAGLPDIKSAQFSFPNLTLKSGRNDLEMMAGPMIPKNIILPEDLNLNIFLKGQLKAFESTVALNCSYGSTHLTARIDQNENFRGQLEIVNFDLGRLLNKKEMFGPVSLIAETSGHGTSKTTIEAKINADVTQLYLNKYTYHHLNLNGVVSGQQFEGKINLDDENAMFDFNGLISMVPNQERYSFRLNVPGVNLNKLNFTKGDIRIGLTAVADLKGGKLQELNGKAGISNLILISEGKKYFLDSLMLVAMNKTGMSDLNISSSLIDLKYSGTNFPTGLPAILNQFINKYFQLSETSPTLVAGGSSAFKFELRLHNHPIISEVLLPQLKAFEPGLIHGSFDEAKSDLKINTTVKNIIYGTTEIKDFSLDILSDRDALNYKISSLNISNPNVRLDHILLEGKLSNQTMSASLSSIDAKQYKKLQVRSLLTKNNGHFRISLDPEFYLMNDRWIIAADNYIEIGKPGFFIHHLFLNKTESQINIASVHDQINDDLSIALINFKLDDISRIIEKDTSLVKGNLNGDVLLKRIDNKYGIVADAKITGLSVRDVMLGDLTVKTGNPTVGKFDVTASLSGNDNNLNVTGYFMPSGGDHSINIQATIQSLALKSIEAFSMGNVTEASGTLSGLCSIQGNITSPDITGELVFNNAFMKPAFLNSRLELKHETILLKSDGLYFNRFSISDADQHTAIIDGTVQMHQFKNYLFNLQVNTKDFLLFNTSARDNKVFNGKMIVDSKIDIKGPMALPVINAKIKIKKGSNFTFAVPENKLTTDRGEDVVQFIDTSKLNPILTRGQESVTKKSVFTGFDLSSIIEVDKQATLKLLMDPASTDSLVVKGEAALSFAIDRSGKMSLTGAYNLNDGSYLVSLESVFKREFDIVPGSTIIWNGDPLDAEISINATYSVRASPYDLVAAQMSEKSSADQGGYKQRYPFLVYLKLRGEILHPAISFEIQLPPNEKGILGGVVNQKLIQLNEDANALNKQVFALLVLGRFIQENPLETESGGTSSIVRSTVGKFLSAQLNQLTASVIPGVELNFDIQSYDDYQSGQAKGRTQVEVGLKKQLFNERLSVQIGGTVDVEGEKAKQNSASDITGDVTIEYKLTKDGRYRLKAFRHNQYEGVIEGQLVETGAGVMYLHDFNKWKEIFSGQKKK